MVDIKAEELLLFHKYGKPALKELTVFAVDKVLQDVVQQSPGKWDDMLFATLKDQIKAYLLQMVDGL